MKNSYCKHSKLSEKQFEALIWYMGYTSSISHKANWMNQHGSCKPISRHTFNNYYLMIGDHLFTNTRTGILNPQQKNVTWPINILMLYVALRQHSIDSTQSKKYMNAFFSNFHGHIDSDLFNLFKLYWRTQKGIKLKRFCSHVGFIIKSHHIRRAISATNLYVRARELGLDADQEYAHFHQSRLLGEFSRRPLDTKAFHRYDLEFSEEGLRLQFFIGNKLSGQQLYENELFEKHTLPIRYFLPELYQGLPRGA
jgi:hypothetical protein